MLFTDINIILLDPNQGNYLGNRMKRLFVLALFLSAVFTQVTAQITNHIIGIENALFTENDPQKRVDLFVDLSEAYLILLSSKKLKTETVLDFS